ncbi:hypothetical protein C5E16_13465 [Clavibacter michiganensis]|uniref:Uncharacterized protein n=1 Tax=Clavibacter michiganensis TaxID=28447 RepID=A0A2S5VR21_9MICO|nr:hypothetical protein [Clavibacter michiganensis]PPF65721.1 hypothetical protein C5E16_13465 [Clavibacter michiganensis]
MPAPTSAPRTIPTTAPARQTGRALGLALVLAVLPAAVLVPAAPAEAQAGYRICGGYRTMPNGAVSEAYIVKVWKEGSATCAAKDAFIQRAMQEGRGLASGFWRMETCEHVGEVLREPTHRSPRVPHLEVPVDPCEDMATNVIYRAVPSIDYPRQEPLMTEYHR